MNALYFRCLFHGSHGGMVHTTSVSGAEGEFCLVSICSAGGSTREEAEDVLRLSGQRISVLVLEGLQRSELGKVQKILRENRVERIFVPWGDELFRDMESDRPEGLNVLRVGESVEICERGWRLWLRCLANGDRGSFAIFHGPEEAREELADCVLAVKAADPRRDCRSCIDPEDHSCLVDCCLYNDFTLCKGHNGKKLDQYVLGTLLLGNADLTHCGAELLRELSDRLPGLRTAAFGNGGRDDRTGAEFLNRLGREHPSLNRYYVFPEGEFSNERSLKTVLGQGPRSIPVLVGEKGGLCCSGFLKWREE